MKPHEALKIKLDGITDIEGSPSEKLEVALVLMKAAKRLTNSIIKEDDS